MFDDLLPILLPFVHFVFIFCLGLFVFLQCLVLQFNLLFGEEIFKLSGNLFEVDQLAAQLQRLEQGVHIYVLAVDPLTLEHVLGPKFTTVLLEELEEWRGDPGVVFVPLFIQFEPAVDLGGLQVLLGLQFLGPVDQVLVRTFENAEFVGHQHGVEVVDELVFVVVRLDLFLLHEQFFALLIRLREVVQDEAPVQTCILAQLPPVSQDDDLIRQLRFVGLLLVLFLLVGQALVLQLQFFFLFANRLALFCVGVVIWICGLGFVLLDHPLAEHGLNRDARQIVELSQLLAHDGLTSGERA